MKTYRRLKNRSVFIKLFGSYIFLLAFIVSIELGITVNILNTSREQTQNLDISLMRLVKNECDNQVRSIFHNLDLLALEDRVQTLSNVKRKFGPESQYMAYTLNGELQSMTLSAGNYRLLYIYFKNTDSVVSSKGNMSLEMYHDLYYRNLDISLEELREYLCRKHYHDIKVLSNNDNACEVMYAMTSLQTDIGDSTATVVIQLTSDAIDSRICSAKWSNEIQAAVINSENEFLNNIEFMENIDQLKYNEIPVNGKINIELEHEKYVGIGMMSEVTDWIYVLLTPKRIMEKNVWQVEKCSLIGLTISLVVGFVFASYFTNRNYDPVRILMDIFQRESCEGITEENEYKWLEKQARSLFQEQEDVRRALNKNQKKLKDFYIYKLLEEPYEALDDYEKDALSRIGISSGILRVVSLTVASESEQDYETQQLKRFIIKNIAGEILNEVFQTQMLDVGNRVIVLVHLNAMDTDNYDKMWDALAKAFDLIKKDFHFNMQICAGTAKEGIEKVHFSYLEAMETEKYAALLDTYFINYKDIKDRSKKYYYPADADNKIITAIVAGKPEPAIACVREIVHTNCQENHIAVSLFPCLIYDLLGTLIRSADEIGCGDFFEKYWVGDVWEIESPIEKSPDEIEELFSQMIKALCQEAEKIKGCTDSSLAGKIERYIKDNFTNPDLNISQVAFYFGKTPAYISSLYKKQTGKSLLKFITKMRMDEAVKLLEEGKSVNETAICAGFRDSRSFIRVFKEYTGVTPGQMRKGNL